MEDSSDGDVENAKWLLPGFRLLIFFQNTHETKIISSPISINNTAPPWNPW
jgi:hypothetical protein